MGEGERERDGREGGEMEGGEGKKRESYFLDLNVPPTTEGHIRAREMDVLQ